MVRTHRITCISVESSICQLLNSVKRFGRHPVFVRTRQLKVVQLILSRQYFHRKRYDLMSVTKQWYRLLYDLEMPLVGQETTNITRFCVIVGKVGQFVSNFDGKRASCHPLKIARCSFDAADHVHRSTAYCQCKYCLKQ